MMTMTTTTMMRNVISDSDHPGIKLIPEVHSISPWGSLSFPNFTSP